MLRLIAFTLALTLPNVALAEDWAYEGGDVPIAYIDNGKAQFQFACRGGDLAMGFWVRAPHHQVTGAASMSMAITPDAAAGAKVAADAGSRFAQDMPLIHSDGASMIVRGPVARQWAKIAQQAKSAVQLAFVRHGKSGLDVYDANRFGAGGSSSAIQKVLDTCG